MRGSSRSSAAGPSSTMRPVCKHIGVVRDLQREIGVLLDHEDRDALLVDRRDQFQHAVDPERRQTHRRLVHADQLRPPHQRARHRHHLLLAARQRARPLVEPLGDAREQLSTRSRSSCDLGAVGARDRRPSAGSRARSSAETAAAPPAPSRCPRRMICDASAGRRCAAPSNATLPERGVARPRMTFIVVDLPLALPPSRRTISPARRPASERSKCTCTGP